MHNRFKPQSEYSKNVLTLMTGSTLSQAIPIAISPILTRIYTPEDFGLYAVYIAIITILGTIVSGRYELAIMLPKKDEDAINIFALGLVITICLTVLTTILVITFNDYIVNLSNNQKMKYWLYIVPVSVFLMGCYNLLIYFNNRLKNFNKISNMFIFKASASAVVQLSLGCIKTGATGLISGQIFSQLMADIHLSIIIFRNKILLSKINKPKMIEMAKRYRDFPKYSVLAILANKLSYQLTNIIVSAIYSITTLGYYAHVQRVLGLPSSLIGTSIGRVFIHEASKEKQNTGKAIQTFKSTMKKLILIGLPIFAFLFMIVEDLFAFVFGEPWRIAGEYAQIVIPFFFVQFIISSISSTETIMEKQNLDLLFNIAILAGSMIVIVVSSSFGFKIFLINWAIVISLLYVIYGFVLMKMADGKI